MRIPFEKFAQSFGHMNPAVGFNPTKYVMSFSYLTVSSIPELIRVTLPCIAWNGMNGISWLVPGNMHIGGLIINFWSISLNRKQGSVAQLVSA